MKNIVKKIIPYFIILIALVGLFGVAGKANAQTAGTCTITPINNEADCKAQGGKWTPATPETPTKAAQEATTAANGTKNPLENALKSCDSIDDWSFDGCMQKIFYTIFYALPAFLLGVTANFFNIILGLTLKGKLLESGFVSSAWGIVRDLSNIFFILILLYVSIKIILDIGSHEAKQTIINIIIIALLINFSMFFAKVVIDTSNVLALVFYNKLQVTTMVNGTEESYIPATRENEKNVSGSMVGAFDVTKFISEDFFDTLKEKTVVVPSKTQIAGALAFPIYGGYLAFSTIKNYFVPQEEVPMGVILSIILIAGSVMIFATYAFLVAGLSFLARIIELWVLIIFSPFAFMSFTIPELKKTDYIGWDAWISRLLTTSFMAPIFMFFMYFIFLLIKSNIFKDMIVPDENRTVWASILFLVLPALFILVLLLQATKFAKKGAGTIGEMVMTGAKIAGGLALGAATGGASFVATNTLGRAGTAVANSGWAKKWEAHGYGGEAVRKAATAIGSGSFDLRGIKIAGKTLGSATGMKVGEARKGGFTERRAEQVTKRQKRAKELEIGENEKLKQELNKTEVGLQKLLNDNAHFLHELDKDIEDARQELSDAAPGANKEAAAKKLAEEKAKKKKFRTDTKDAQGRSIADLEKTIIPGQKDAIEKENRRRKWIHAKSTESGLGQAREFIFSGGQHSFRGAREAAYKIRMDAKIEDSGKGHGGGDHGGGHTPAAAKEHTSTPTPKPSAPAKGGGGGHEPKH